MMLGREVFQPLDVILGVPEVSSRRKEVPQYIKELVETLNKAHNIARENLKTAQERQKRTYDIYNNHKFYNIGDVVYKLDQATKVGQSSKLKSPWKGPYIIIQVKTSVLYKVKDKKGESWIHHDRLKLCNDRELPVWIKRLRNNIQGRNTREDQNTESETDIIDPSSLFHEKDDTVRVRASDVLVSHTDSDHDNLGAPDVLVSQDIHGNDDPDDRNFDEINRQITYLQDLLGVPTDLDETLVYDIEDQDKAESTSQNKDKRARKRPAYLEDYVQE